MLSGRVIRYRRERWVTSEGRAIVAALPPGVSRHFGPELAASYCCSITKAR